MRERLGAAGRPRDAAEPITGESVARAAQQGDPLAQEVMDEVARNLGTGLGGAINLMNPERIVLGGGVTKSGERWWRIVRETARYHALPQMRVDIQPAALGDDAPLWGAVALAEPLTMIEIIHNHIERGHIRHALFDFDGTVSLIREGWQQVMTSMMVELLLQTPRARRANPSCAAVVTEIRHPDHRQADHLPDDSTGRRESTSAAANRKTRWSTNTSTLRCCGSASTVAWRRSRPGACRPTT